MPIYDYKCRECNHVMKDKLRKFEEKVITCEECEKETSEQQFSGMFAAHGLPNGHNAVRVRRR